MYGLILEGIGDAMRRKFGDQAWEETRQKAGIAHHSFNMHRTYSETVIPRLAKAASDITGRPIDDLMELCGYSFVAFIAPYGYDRVLRVLGRHLRDLLSGLDNLHEYLKFSYPKLKPPSFFCEHETRHGLILHYRSKRRGFVYYVMGQVTQLAKTFYDTPLEIELLSEEESMDMTHVVLKLHFDNTAFSEEEKVPRDTEKLPVSADLFFETFPFHIVFRSNMTIASIGAGLGAVLPHLVGMAVDEMFTLTRPLIEFTMDNVLSHLNNVFEVMTVEAVRKTTTAGTTSSVDEDDYDPDDKRRCLIIKGQMMFMEEWDAILFLGTPVMENLDKMFDTGLFINDLSMHDSSRDLVLAGTQQQAELKMAMDQEKQKSNQLENILKKMDKMESQVLSLLTFMGPRTVSRSVGKGESVEAVCQVYDAVTVLSSDIQGFCNILERSSPMQAMSMLNTMMLKFDALCDQNKCVKLENRANEYMVCSGAPNRTRYHAVYVCDMAVDMVTACEDIRDPASGNEIKIKIGIVSGACTAGVVGYRIPVFDIAGTTVMAATKISQAGMGGKIHVADSTKSELSGYGFDFEDGGTVDCKGLGSVSTHWLNGRTAGATRCAGQCDETGDVGDNVAGFIPEMGKPIAFSQYQALLDE